MRYAHAGRSGTTRHGITSARWRAWGGSFVVLRGAVAGPRWEATAYYRGRLGSRYTYLCPPGGKPDVIYGTDAYTDDSSVCTAAVHSGRITLAQGGTVKIQIRPGLSSYDSTTANGITSRRWGFWPRSFLFV